MALEWDCLSRRCYELQRVETKRIKLNGSRASYNITIRQISNPRHK
ncbi:hypothetical protein SeF3a_093 [Salmonella phage SeF3a]|nr:hypothetical protein SeF3a_093 [Salmonella phage SeF3a]WDS51410.1 hypothetical protein SeF6a_094 [Salmonella phage SeF6a]